MASSSSTATSGTFNTVNGQIIGPNGQPFVARGINLYDADMSDAPQILQQLPSINFIRLNIYSYQSPSAYSAFINTMTSHGVVVEFEDHTTSDGSDAGGGSGSAFTGQMLTNELNWYSSVASAYANNPYVWFGTDNEPPAAGLTTWEQQTYNAVRSTGNTSPVLISIPGGGYPGGTESSYGMTPSVYAAMTNIVADVHFYGWAANYSTDQSTVTSTLDNLISGAQTITSANGTVPVIIGEFGNSETDTQAVPDWQQVLSAVQNSGYGFAAWNWYPGTQTDDITDDGATLSPYGQQIAAAIAASAAAQPTPTPTPAPTPTPTPAPTPTPTPAPTPTPTPAPTPTPTPAPTPTPTPSPTPSPNDTVVKAPSTAAITDTGGNKWTITSGAQVAFNGKAITGTANVVELAYVNATVWQENAAGNWYSIVDSNGTFSAGVGPTTTSPLPATPTPTPAPTPTPTPAPTPTPTPTPTASPNDTMVLAGATSAITDASGNKWTITSGAQVAFNGATITGTANVTELAYVNGTVWQQNAAGNWYSIVHANGTFSAGVGPTTTSPLPAPLTIAASTATTTVTQSQLSVIATAGSHMVFIKGSGDVVSLTGGTDTVTDTGGANTYLLPAAGHGTNAFTSNILTLGDTLDFKPALAATSWNGQAASLSSYLSVADTQQGATISIAASPGAKPTPIATISGATTLNLATLLTHAIT